MRIAHVRVDEGFGGLARFILSLLQGFGERAPGIEHVVIPMRTPGELGRRARDAGYPVFHFPMPARLDPTARRRMRRLLVEQTPDLVCTYCVRSDVVAGAVAADLGIPWIAQVANPRGEYRNPLLGRLLLAADARALRRAQAVVTLSHEGVALLRSRLPEGARILRIPNGVETNLPRVGANRDAFDLPAGTPVVGAAGRLAPVKGYDVLLNAAAKVLEVLPATRFVVAGEGPEADALTRLAREMGVDRQVRFPGFVKDIRPFLGALDVFCMPSRTEGHPFALLEAMAEGLPIVASAAGGIPELVRDGEEALLVPAEDPDSLAAALVRLLSDPEGRATMGRKARARVEREFSFDGMANAYLDLYRDTLRDFRAGGSA